ncbi:MAG: hypothetical protein LC753_15775 [Acidobacteria bacterium]|nr:hypothetical protein [Acidobacteriota bacterium]MCA1651663.1 hypothetical protein [Acidobacteriota bacterium]
MSGHSRTAANKVGPLILVALLSGGVASYDARGRLSAQPHTEQAPAGLATEVAAALSPGGVRAIVASTTLDFWFVKVLPLKEMSGTPTWSDAEEGALVGAVRVSAPFHDIRGRVIKPGVYTLRYGIQPENGDHLGVSPFRQFLLLSPASLDQDTAPRGHDGAIELSKRAIGGSHPGVWSIDPPVTNKALLATHVTELQHDAVIVEIPVQRGSQPPETMRFGIVLIGKIDA